jgi:hypothetical protein
MERTNDYINVWFWERSDPWAPPDVTCGASTVDTSQWVILFDPLFNSSLTHNLTAREWPLRTSPTLSAILRLTSASITLSST